MMLWFIVCAVILCLLILVLCATVTISLSAIHEREASRVAIHIRYFYGLVHLHRTFVPGGRTQTTEGTALQIKQQGDAVKHHKKTFTARDAWGFVSHIGNRFQQFRKLWPIVKRILSHCHIKQFRLDAEMGFGNVIETGMAVGAGWALLGSAVGYCTSICQFDVHPQLDVRANFQQSTVQVRFEGIMTLRTGYAISGALRALWVWKRGTHHGASNSRADADSDDQHSGNGGREHHHRRSG